MKLRFLFVLLKFSGTKPFTLIRLFTYKRITTFTKLMLSDDAFEKRRVILLYFNKLKHETVEQAQLSQSVGYSSNKNLNLPPISYKPKVLNIRQYEPPMHFELPHFSTVKVSIVIPAYNQWPMTKRAIYSILRSVRDVAYEVILADDNSTDDTVNAVTFIKNLKVSRTPSNLGFLQNCNLAAKQTSGQQILFLNNDVIVHDNWLEPLVEVMQQDNVVISGSKLVYPDGRLQEAGGIIWRDGSGWNYGRLSDPDHPGFNYCKSVDYISGASLLVKKSFWLEVGGFDTVYTPAYFEDTDLCFKARQLGYEVIYQPQSVITHFEGQSHGTDEGAGIKAYQAINRQTFERRWQDVLATEHFNHGEHEFWAKERSQHKPCIVVIDHYVPWFDKDAGSRSTFMYLEAFVKLGYNVKFIGDNFYPHQPYTDKLQSLGIEVLHGQYFAENWQAWLYQHRQYIDMVYLHRPHIATNYIDFIKQHLNCKVIYQCHDLHFQRLMRSYELTANEEDKLASLKWLEVEKQLFHKADIGLSFSDQEVSLISQMWPEVNVQQIPLFLYDDGDVNPVTSFDTRADILFVGGFNHQPNQDAIIWFLDCIWPLISQELPELQFNIVGSNIPQSLSSRKDRGVNFVGFVSDAELERLYLTTKVAILPLRYGAGVKGKLIEAMKFSVPVVATAIALEGISSQQCAYDQATEFANEVIRLCTSKRHWIDAQATVANDFSHAFTLKQNSALLKNIFSKKNK